MTAPILEVSDLGKRYIIQHEAKHQGTLRDTLQQGARHLWRRLRGGGRFEKEEFWALRDINFAVHPSEVIGIIGRNGAGKSTLLKCLSRITEPTRGQITLRGRVASLLEVGTGFHPELSGRENIYLNGSILGMTRAEIRKKFDEIVAFAEVEKFLDTPVKRYSSGMYVRLAFAVAAHLEPEILIVDEVLAVGDMQFQEKCLGKIQDVARGQGRTVLFVSHNLGYVRQLCPRAILLDRGKIISDGESGEVLKVFSEKRARPTSSLEKRYKPKIVDLTVDESELGKGNIRISIYFDSPYLLVKPYAGIVVLNGLGQPVLGTDMLTDPIENSHSTQNGILQVMLEKAPLTPGTYRLNVWFGDGTGTADYWGSVCEFHFPGLPGRRLRPAHFSTEAVGSLDYDAHWTQISQL